MSEVSLKAMKSIIETAARESNVVVYANRNSKQQRVLCKTVGDLEMYGSFINQQVLYFHNRYGIKKILSEVLGCSSNRVGEWERLWLAATTIYHSEAVVKDALSNKDKPLSALVKALRNVGWKEGKKTGIVYKQSRTQKKSQGCNVNVSLSTDTQSARQGKGKRVQSLEALDMTVCSLNRGMLRRQPYCIPLHLDLDGISPFDLESPVFNSPLPFLIVDMTPESPFSPRSQFMDMSI
jgi:hypothetical protein